MVKRTDMAAEYVNTLRQADIFYDLSESQLEMVAGLCSELTPKAGELIFEENSASDELYVIASGEVDIQVSLVLVQSARAKPAAPATPLTIVTLRRGQTFGEVALVDEGLRSASARCASKKARLLVIPRDRLIRLCDGNTDLGYRLMRNIAADLAFKIRGTDMTIRDQLLWHPRPK
jgi:CRP/FNR family cyclic AMP-dependent transcriptional regulator